MPKSEYMHMRVDPALKAMIREEAKKRHVDSSALVSLILSEWLARNAKQRIDLSAATPLPRPE